MTQGTATPLRPEDAEKEAEMERASDFDRLVSDWMIAHAKSRKADTDEEMDAFSKRKHELFWKILSTSAPLPRHTDDKFTVMLLDVGDDKLWRGYTAMIESIRSDIDNGWDDWERSRLGPHLPGHARGRRSTQGGGLNPRWEQRWSRRRFLFSQLGPHRVGRPGVTSSLEQHSMMPGRP